MTQLHILVNATSLHKTETVGAAIYKSASRTVLVCTDNLLLVSYGSNTEISSTDLPHCNKRYNYPSLTRATCHRI